MTEQFIVINTTQEKVRKEQILTTKGSQNALSGSQQWSFDVIKKLNELSSSPLKSKIAFFAGDKGKIVKNTRMSQVVSSNCQNLTLISADQAASQIANYLSAWTQLYSNAWDNPKIHMIGTAIGIEMLMTVYSVVESKRSQMHSHNTNVSAWSSVIASCINSNIDVPGIGYNGKPISWLKEDFKVMAASRHNTDALKEAFRTMVISTLKET
jgi:hypothetical protein